MNDAHLHNLLDSSDDHFRTCLRAKASLVRERRALIKHIADQPGLELTHKTLALIDESISIINASADWEEKYHREHPDTERPAEEPYETPYEPD